MADLRGGVGQPFSIIEQSSLKRCRREIARVRPLGTAAFVGRPDLEKLLLEAGADASLPREEQQPSGS